jgi:hypothetical protein
MQQTLMRLGLCQDRSTTRRDADAFGTRRAWQQDNGFQPDCWASVLTK